MFFIPEEEDLYNKLVSLVEWELSYKFGRKVVLDGPLATEYHMALAVILRTVARDMVSNQKLFNDMVHGLLINDNVNLDNIETISTQIQEKVTSNTVNTITCHFCTSQNVQQMYSEYFNKHYLVCPVHKELL